MSTLVISWCLHYWRNLTWLWQWLFSVKKLGYVCQLMCIIVRKILLRWEAGLPMLWKYNNTSWFVPLDFFQKKKAYLPTQQTMLPRDYSKLRIKYNVHTRHLCSRERNKTKRQQRKRERIIWQWFSPLPFVFFLQGFSRDCLRHLSYCEVNGAKELLSSTACNKKWALQPRPRRRRLQEKKKKKTRGFKEEFLWCFWLVVVPQLLLALVFPLYSLYLFDPNQFLFLLRKYMLYAWIVLNNFESFCTILNQFWNST